jgi:hypothetical protein
MIDLGKPVLDTMLMADAVEIWTKANLSRWRIVNWMPLSVSTVWTL